MKWFATKVALLLLLAVSLNSCKKDTSVKVGNNVADLINLNDAKAFFNNEVLPNSPQTLAKKDLTDRQLLADPSVNDLLYKEPVWEKAYGKVINGKIGVAVPIHFKLRSFVRTGEKVGINFDNLNYLFIYKDATGKLVAEWVTLSPDLEWANGKRKNYTGRIKVADWDGNLKKVFFFDKNGKMISYRRPANNNLYINFQNSESFAAAGQGKLMGRKYRDVNGECWEDIREVQSSDGLGVTLIRKRIDCAELEPPAPSQPGDGSENGYGAGGGDGYGSGGGAGGGAYVPINCNDDPSWDPSTLPPLEGGLAYVDRCGSSSPVEPMEPEEPEDPVDEPEVVLDTDCESFTFVRTSTANWQEAGLNKIKLEWYWIGGNNGRVRRYIEVNHVVYGFPAYYTNANGTTTPLSAGEAANRAAEATERARNDTYVEFKKSPYLPDDAAVKKYFINRINSYMMLNRGTAGSTGSGSPNIIFNNEERSHITDPNDC